MDKCTKFKIFNVTILFCLFNFFLYRFFAYPGVNPFLVFPKTGNPGTPLRSGPGPGPGPDPNLSRIGLANDAFHPGNGRQQTSSPNKDLQTVKGIGEDNNNNNEDNDKPNHHEPPGKDVKEPEQNSPPNQGGGEKPAATTPIGSGAKEPKSDSEKPGPVVGKLPETPKPPPPSTNLDEPSKDVTSQKATKTEGASAPLPLCPLLPPKLTGPLATYTDTLSFGKIAELNPLLQPGGRFKPSECVSRHRVAIVIPYRNREQHLKILLHNLHPMLQRQQLDYGIFVIEQELPTRFNRAMLMNIGFVEALKTYDYQCAIFHDVDLIPENDHNIYSCPQMPRHLSAAIDKFKYRLPYAGIYGGVSAMTKEHMEKVNGFSNLFFGWGGEDDDMAARIKAKGLKISRYPMTVARYRMIKHSGKESGNEPNPQRYALLKNTDKRMDSDGLNTLKYTVKKVDQFPTHTQILVFINENDFRT